MIEWVTTFVPICLAASYVCSSMGERDLRVIGRRTAKLFATLTLGILVFCGVVQLASSIV